MKNLEKIEESLDNLHRDFNLQINELSNDANEFHNNIIDLTAKYPEHKEILQFMVYINDKLEINHKLFSEIVTDHLNGQVEIKKDLLNKIKDGKEIKKGEGLWSDIYDTIGSLKDAKIVMLYIIIIMFVVGAIFAPTESLKVLEFVINIIM
jgi:hypothetical protein